ncbi:MAG TPA: phage holin family protein [Acidimicrobiales bacterium]|nr:phage holin family protein [Acidimicrobiales bacterium]
MSVEGKSTADLFRDLSNEMTALVHQEIELAKVELAEKTKKVGAGAGLFGGAAVTGLLAAGALVAAAIAGIATVLSVWLAALIVGVILLGVAGVMAVTGRAEVAQGSPPIPEEAIQSSKEDVEWLKTQARSAKP